MSVTIIKQPPSNSLNAAYRPILIICNAEQGSPSPSKFIPPVVYCDIYFNGIYYKTISNTIPENVPVYGSVPAQFVFDIQDACQEFHKKHLPNNPQTAILETNGIMMFVACKIRSSTVDVNGFTNPDTPIPVQGTGYHPPVPGGGVVTNIFFSVNATLQHENNQDLVKHLDQYKSGIWSNVAWPLTHRPSNYRVCKNDSDVFPIIYTGSSSLKCLRLNYKNKGSGVTISETVCFPVPAPPCSPVSSPLLNLPDAIMGDLYDSTITLSGSGPFTLSSSTVPGWATATLTGNTIHVYGVPELGDVGTGITFAFSIENACGAINLSDTINVYETAPACNPVGFSSILPDGEVGVAYSWESVISGDAPFELSSVVKPAWMSVSISGSSVFFSGIPTTEATGVEVSFTLSNCSGGSSVNFSDTIDIQIEESEYNMIASVTGTGSLNSIAPAFYLVMENEYPIDNTSGNLLSQHVAYNGVMTVNVTGSGTLKLYINNLLVQTEVVDGPGPEDVPMAINVSNIDKIKIVFE